MLLCTVLCTVLLLMPTVASLSITVPCGGSITYTAANTSDHTQFVIRSCPGVTPSGVYEGTALLVNFSNSNVPPPANISVVVEHSVSVSVRVDGGGTNESGAFMLVDFALVMTNVTNPATPAPPTLRSCTAALQDVWCGPMVQLSRVALVGARLTLSNVSYLRGEDSVLYVLLAAASRDVVIRAHGVAHTGRRPLLYVTGKGVSPHLSDVSIVITNITVRISSVVSRDSMGTAVLWLGSLVMANVAVLVSSVAFVDAGVSGTIASIVMTSLQSSGNVTVHYTNASHVLAPASTFMVLNAQFSALTSSQLLLRNVTVSGTSVQAVSIYLNTMSLAGVCVLAVEDTTMIGDTVVALYAMDSNMTSNTAVVVSGVQIEAISGGALVECAVSTAPSSLSDVSITISDSRAVGVSSTTTPNLYVLTCAGMLMTYVVAQLTRVTLDGGIAGVLLSSSPGVAQSVHLVVTECWLSVTYPVFLQSMHLVASSVELSNSIFAPYDSYATVVDKVAMGNSTISVLNITLGVTPTRSTTSATFMLLQFVTLDHSSSLTLRHPPAPVSGVVHVGPVAVIGVLALRGGSSLVIVFDGNIVYPASVDTYLVSMTDCVLSGGATITVVLPLNVTSLRTTPHSSPPFGLQRIVLTQNSSIVIRGTSGGPWLSAVRWAQSDALIQLANITAANSVVLVYDMQLHNTIVTGFGSNSAIVVGGSTFRSGGALMIFNVTFTLANVTKQSSGTMIGFVVVSTTFDGAQLVVDAVRCQDRDDAMTTSLRDPGYALCLVLQGSMQNLSVVIISNVVSLSTSVFCVLRLDTCTLHDTATMHLVVRSLISFVASQLVMSVGIPLVNRPISFINCVIAGAVTLLNGSRVAPLGGVPQVGVASNVSLVLAANTVFSGGAAVTIANVSVELPDGQCGAASSRASVLHVVNVTVVSGGALLRVDGVRVLPAAAACASLVVEDGGRVGSSSTLWVSVAGVEWRVNCSAASTLPPCVLGTQPVVPVVSVGGVSVDGDGGGVSLSVASSVLERGAVIDVWNVRGGAGGPLRVLVAVTVDNATLGGAAGAPLQPTAGLIVLRNVTSLSPSTVAVAVRGASRLLLPPPAAAVLCAGCANVALSVLVSSGSSLVSPTWWAMGADDAAAAAGAALAGSTASSANVTVDGALVVGAVVLLRVGVAQERVASHVDVYCSVWSRHAYSAAKWVGRGSPVMPAGVSASFYGHGLELGSSTTCPVVLDASPTQVLGSRERTHSRTTATTGEGLVTSPSHSGPSQVCTVGATASLPFTTTVHPLARSGSLTTLSVRLPHQELAKAPHASGAAWIIRSSSGVGVVASVLSAASTATGSPLIRYALTARLVECAMTSTEAIVSGDSDGAGMFSISVGEAGSPGHGYRSGIVGYLIIVMGTGAVGAAVVVALRVRAGGHGTKETSWRRTLGSAALPGWWLGGPCTAAIGPLVSSACSLISVVRPPSGADVVCAVAAIAASVVPALWIALSLLAPAHGGWFTCRSDGAARRVYAAQSSAVKRAVTWLLHGGYRWRSGGDAPEYAPMYGSLFASMRPEYLWFALLDVACSVVTGVVAAVPAFAVRGGGDVAAACEGALHATTAVQLAFAVVFVWTRPLAVRWELWCGGGMVGLAALGALLGSVEATVASNDAVQDAGNVVQALLLCVSGLLIAASVVECVVALHMRRRWLLTSPPTQGTAARPRPRPVSVIAPGDILAKIVRCICRGQQRRHPTEERSYCIAQNCDVRRVW